MVEEIMMNTTMAGLGNLSAQTGTIGTTTTGMLTLLLVIGLAFYLSHEMNTKNSWLARLLNWINRVGGFKAIIGAWTAGVVWTGWQISGWLGSSEGQGSLVWFVEGIGLLILAFVVLVGIGYVSEPVWAFIWDYCTGKKKKKEDKP